MINPPAQVRASWIASMISPSLLDCLDIQFGSALFREGSHPLVDFRQGHVSVYIRFALSEQV